MDTTLFKFRLKVIAGVIVTFALSLIAFYFIIISTNHFHRVEQNNGLISIPVSLLILLVVILIIGISILHISITKGKVKREKYKSLREPLFDLNILESLYETSNDSLLILDENLTIVDCNKKALSLRGLTKDKMIGRNPLEFTHPIQTEGKNASELAEEMFHAANSGNPLSREWKIIGTDKKIRYSLATASKFELNNKNYYYLALSDITERKNMEKELLYATIQTEEIERARFAKELHDGVGPIFSTVKLYFQWLSENMDTDKRIEIIKMGNKNIEEAIKALKQVSYNLSPYILENFGIVTALKEFIANVSKASTFHIDFKTNLNERLVREVEITLYRVLTELINNTLKYAEAQNVEISIMNNPKDEQLKVLYSDDGKGFNMKKEEKKYKGLGITNIQSRIKTLGGNIKYSSSPNNGVNVSIIIHLNEINEE